MNLDQIEKRPKKIKEVSVQKNQRMKFFNKNFKSILVLSGALVIFLIYIFLFGPALKSQQEFSQAAIDKKQAELEDAKNILDEINKLNGIYEQISPQLKEKIINILPPDSEIANIYYNLEQMAEKVGYKLIAVNMDEIEDKKKKKLNIDSLVLEQETEKLKKIDVLITLEGSGYLKVKDFLDLLEKNLRLVDIQTIEYSAEDTVLNIKMRVYYYQANEQNENP